jgi:hypothetical protein
MAVGAVNWPVLSRNCVAQGAHVVVRVPETVPLTMFHRVPGHVEGKSVFISVFHWDIQSRPLPV